jgi:flagellar motor switch protein FliN/FliY
MGAVATAMGTETGTSISTPGSSCELLDPSDHPINHETGYVASCELNIEGLNSEEVLFVYSEELANSLKSLYGHTVDTSRKNSPSSSKDKDFSRKRNTPSIEDDLVVEEVSSVGHSSVYTGSGNPNIDMLLDISLDVNIELGRAQMSIRKILELGPGAIVEIDRKASEPVDLLINDKIIARGEVVVVDEYFGIRIVSLLSPEDRIKQLR